MQGELEKISHLSRKHLKTIKKITEPLLNQFGITYFARQSVSKDGYWEILGNIPDWLDHSASKKFYSVDPSLLHPNHYQTGLIVNSSHTVPDFLKDMSGDALSLYDIEHTLCIFEKTVTGGEWYFFATSAKNNKIMGTYITQINLIYKYIKYFNVEAQKLLQTNLDFRIDVSKLKGEPFDSNAKKIDLTPFTFTDEEMFNLQGKNISFRERDCLYHLFRGKTIKETAKLLKLSPRTVEEYLNRIKQKTGCKYKRDLLHYFQN
jgi:DNA-binding CsgD family transcriptional regulator